jgi:hypothetical protein
MQTNETASLELRRRSPTVYCTDMGVPILRYSTQGACRLQTGGAWTTAKRAGFGLYASERESDFRDLGHSRQGLKLV